MVHHGLMCPPCSSSTSIYFLAWLRSFQTERLRPAERLLCHPALKASGLFPEPCPRSRAWYPLPAKGNAFSLINKGDKNTLHFPFNILDDISLTKQIFQSCLPPQLGPVSVVACGCWTCWVGRLELHLGPVLLEHLELQLAGQHLEQTWKMELKIFFTVLF